MTNEKRSAGTVAKANPWRAAGALASREWVRFFRQRNRVVGAIGQPLLFWAMFGAGMNRVFRVEGQNFSEYYFPGTLILILLFTAIFTTISIIEDRREGFLQSVLVAPMPRWAMVVGKVLGGSLIALAQGLLFLLLAFTLGIRFSPLTAGLIAVWLFLVSVGFTGLGYLIAWRMQSTQGFHAIMTLVLMPMWLLSGAFFPVPVPTSDAGVIGTVMHWIMKLNPATYAVAGLRNLLYMDVKPMVAEVSSAAKIPEMWVPSMATCWVVVLVFAVLVCGWSTKISARHTKGDLL
ncbi:MAG: ABC transporter permease [Planctomycetales bacterium]|nr:ABC transporter permease [Planctomycetales bacterium]